MRKKVLDIPLYRELYEELRTDICRGIYLPGELLPPIREMAKRLQCAGVKTNKEYTERELCAYIRRFLKKHRGIDCREEQIFLCQDMCEANRLIRNEAYVLYR